MDKWEYMIVDSKDIGAYRSFRYKDCSEVEQYLNALGADGWEIVNLDLDCHYPGSMVGGSLDQKKEPQFMFTGVAKRAKPS